jgi:hypothetical protein
MWTVHLGPGHEEQPDPIVRERWTDAKDVLRRTLEERRTLALALWNRRGFDELNEALWTLQDAKPDQPFSVSADRCSFAIEGESIETLTDPSANPPMGS